MSWDELQLVPPATSKLKFALQSLFSKECDSPLGRQRGMKKCPFCLRNVANKVYFQGSQTVPSGTRPKDENVVGRASACPTYYEQTEVRSTRSIFTGDGQVRMKHTTRIVHLIIVFCWLAACSSDDPEDMEITDLPTSTPAAAFSLPTASPTPTSTALSAETPPAPSPTATRPLSLPAPPDIPLVVYTIDLNAPINAALVSPADNRLYLLNENGTLRILNLTDYVETVQLQTGQEYPYGYGPYGQLTLDPPRKRLYISGSPVQVLDTGSLQLKPLPELKGQVTPDPGPSGPLYYTPRCACQIEQCNTFLLDPDTLAVRESLFPPQNPFNAPCVTATQLDPQNQLLYAQIYNGVPGSNSGSYFSFFDVTGPPTSRYTAGEISYGPAAFDPSRQRAYVTRYRMSLSDIHRYDISDAEVVPTIQLAGVRGELVYDPLFDRLYAVNNAQLLVFDADLTLLSEIALPEPSRLLAFDSPGQRLYLRGMDGGLVVVATGGGSLSPPPDVPEPLSAGISPRRIITADGSHFRLLNNYIFRSDDGGQTWQVLGRGLPMWAVQSLAVSPNFATDQTLLAGLNTPPTGGGLYRSSDGGQTWQPSTRGLNDLAISKVAFSPTYAQDKTIFLTTANSGALFRSTDGGDTWHSLADRYALDTGNQGINDFVVSPNFANDGLLIISRETLLRSEDGGDTWLDTGQPGSTPLVMSPNVADDGLILAGGRWRSTDAGHTWQPAAEGLATSLQGADSIIFSPDFAADQTVYLLLAAEFDKPPILHRAIDGGQSWQRVLGGLPASDLAIITPLPNGRLLLTADNGQEQIVDTNNLVWGQPAINITALDLQALAIAPDGTIFVANNAAGVFRSKDGGRTWLESGFPARTFTADVARLGVGDDGHLFAGVGPVVARSPDLGRTWQSLHGLPPRFEVESLALSANFAADQTLFVGGNFMRNDIIRSSDGGDTWQTVFDGSTIEGSSAIRAIALSPNFAADGVAYAWLEQKGLLRSTDGGLTWQLIEGKESQYYAIQAMAVSPDNRLYLGGLDGLVLVSDNGGQTWIDIGRNIPDRRIWNSAFAFNGAGNTFLGTSLGVYRTPNGGQSWLHVSDGLARRPDTDEPQSVRALQFYGDQLYAAQTTGGLFVTENSGQSWRSTLAQTPALTPTPTPVTVQPTCLEPPVHFAAEWAGRIDQLGCPNPPGRRDNLLIATQPFENGLMLWRSDSAEIYALPAGQPFFRTPDTWDSSQREYTCPADALSQTPPTPKRGFGKVWCQTPSLRVQLGNATGQESTSDVRWEEFEFGSMFGREGEAVYILDNLSGEWEHE